MKRFKWIIILVILALAGTGIWYWFFNKKEVPVTVVTEKPHTGDISISITSTGTIEPVDTVVVGSQVSGPIKFVFVDFNSKVKKGQLLAQIDKTVLQAQLQQIQANLASAISALQYEQSNYTRQTKLLEVGAISKADFETALNTFNAAKAQVDNLQSQVKAAEKNLSYTDIYSPIDGTVLTRNVSVGQTVAASFNTPTLFIIANDLTKMQVQAAVDEADIGNVMTGQNVTFTVDAFPNDVFEGTVQKILLNPKVSSNVVTYTTLINAANNDMKLKPGMTASVTIITKENKNALLIPVKALSFKPDSAILKNYVILGRGSYKNNSTGKSTQANQAGTKHIKPADSTAQAAFIWLKTGDTIRQKKIYTGLNDEAYAEVVQGLTANDDVVTGTEQLTSANKKQAASTTRSPFMPQRRSSNKRP